MPNLYCLMCPGPIEDNRFTSRKALSAHIDSEHQHSPKFHQLLDEKLDEIRTAAADVIASSGCGCCRDREEYYRYLDILGELLNVPKYDDNSGRNFYLFRSKE